MGANITLGWRNSRFTAVMSKDRLNFLHIIWIYKSIQDYITDAVQSLTGYDGDKESSTYMIAWISNYHIYAHSNN